MRRANFLSFAITLVAAIIGAVLSPYTLQSDDIQIAFMLLNGGYSEGAMGYSIYTNYALGWCIAQVSCLLPSLNVYLLYMFCLSFLACWSVNFVVLNAQIKSMNDGGTYRKMFIYISSAILLLINITCLKNLQYTHVGVWAAVSGVLLLSSITKDSPWILRSLISVVLVLGAYALRSSALIPALFVSFAVLPWKIRNKRVVGVSIMMALLVTGLYSIHAVSYKQNPQWETASNFLKSRVKILDSPDNSKIDKSDLLIKQGIAPETYTLFRTFIYTPSMYSLNKVNQALLIHNEGRKGLFGIQKLADMGFLEATMGERLGSGLTLFQRMTPWMPLVLALVCIFPVSSRPTFIRVAGMISMLAIYVCILLGLQRMVGRVLDPVLYIAAVYVLTLPLKSSAMSENRCVRFLCVGMSMLTFLFYTRHWMIQSHTVQAANYCAAHPHKLYLTTCQQGLGLYPYGFGGYSLHWLQQANILPIADGWNYYTPAYDAALRVRGHQSLQSAMLHPDTLIVVREGGLSITKKLAQLAFSEWGKKIEFSVVDTYGGFHFLKIVQN